MMFGFLLYFLGITCRRLILRHQGASQDSQPEEFGYKAAKKNVIVSSSFDLEPYTSYHCSWWIILPYA